MDEYEHGFWELCEYWDEDGCYCICEANCSCGQVSVVDIGNELRQILADAILANKPTR